MSDEPSPLDAVQAFVASELRELSAVPERPQAAERAHELLTGNSRLSAAEQLEIYRQQFWLRHTAALLEDYPGVSGILGQHEWEQLAESYLTEVPPRSWTLRDLGRDFARHIAGRAGTPHQQLCFDMATLEWAYTEVFDAAESPALDVSRLQSASEEAWSRAVVHLAPALRILSLTYPVAELRRRLRDAAADDAGEPISIPGADPHFLVVFRSPKRHLRYVRLGQAPGSLLRHLASGMPLTTACERAAGTDPAHLEQIEAEVGSWFADWTRRGWIVNVELDVHRTSDPKPSPE